MPLSESVTNDFMAQTLEIFSSAVKSALQALVQSNDRLSTTVRVCLHPRRLITITT